ncbi:MAG: class I SAM-dependent methyltransferase [Acidobacteria bacterium]|nr:class I SAM-dependent methyltransferase [Acidobacteriota bacterium]
MDRTDCPACSGPLKVLGLRANHRQGLFSGKGLYCAIVRCQHCFLVFPNPMPVPLQTMRVYDVSPDDYFHHPAGDSDRVATHLLKMTGLDRKENLRILEVGSGRGNLAQALFQLGHQVTGLEPSPAFFRKAAELAGPEFRQETYEETKVEGQFDLVLFVAVFEHFPDLEKVLSKSFCLLRPGGKMCIVNVPNAFYWKTRLINFGFKALLRPFVIHCSPLHPPFHFYEFSKKSLAGMLQKAGFKVERIWVETGHTYRYSWMYRWASFWVQKLGHGEIIRTVAIKPE